MTLLKVGPLFNEVSAKINNKKLFCASIEKH